MRMILLSIERLVFFHLLEKLSSSALECRFKEQKTFLAQNASARVIVRTDSTLIGDFMMSERSV